MWVLIFYHGTKIFFKSYENTSGRDGRGEVIQISRKRRIRELEREVDTLRAQVYNMQQTVQRHERDIIAAQRTFETGKLYEAMCQRVRE